jgi:hypothetical protein
MLTAAQVPVVEFHVQRVEETSQYKYRSRSITALGAHTHRVRALVAVAVR